jgi:dihydrofolate synthase/folylpolyglutamate synthase
MPSIDALIERLFSYTHIQRSERNLLLMRDLDAYFGHPHRRFRSVHVGGTNGKGSVSFKMASALDAAGYKTGLYTSPHIVSVRERIQILPVGTGEIEEAFLIEHLPILFAWIDRYGEPPTFFEILTMLGFLYFAAKKVEWAVIEVGMGGRLDATNVITPALSVITSIGADHLEWLGPTLEDVAREKGGIIKSQVPFVLGPRAAEYQALMSRGPAAVAPLPSSPFYDCENQEIARTALEALAFLPPPAIEKGIALRPPCRFEERGRYILDVAHNPQGFYRLAQALQFFYPDERFDWILAFSASKDSAGCLKEIAPIARTIQFVRIAHPRLASPESLLPLAPAPAAIAESIEEALYGNNLQDRLRAASAGRGPDEATQEGRTVIAGTFFHMAEALRALSIPNVTYTESVSKVGFRSRSVQNQ